MLLRCCLSWTCLWIGLSVAHAAERTVLIDDSFEDFAAGTPDDGGHNVYVARDGTLRTIQRFDLNGDGYLDILFNCTHNTYQMLPPSVGSVSAARAAFTGEIAVEGSQHCVVADLNRDGYDDIVFCPNGIGVHHDRRFVMVAWGSVDGWTAQHVNSPLPMNAASKVDVADLNGDGWLDIAVLGAQRWLPNQPLGRIIRIYWGSASGYQVTRLHDLGVPGAVDLASADFDLDGHRDLVVLRGEGRLSIFWRPAAGTPQPDTTETAHDDSEASCLAAADVTGDGRPDLVIGSRLARLTVVPAGPDRTWQAARPSPAFPATQITISDLDADHKADAVLTQFDQARAAGGEQAGAGQGAQDVVRILWGATNGFSVDRSTRLTIPLAVATAAGDLDGDGHTDLAVAIHQGTDTFAGESQVYFGSGREFVRGASGFRTSGTLHVAIAPARSGRPAQAIFCNSIGGQLDEAVPLHLYWGSAHGFDPQRIWKIPMHSGYEASAADLDADGHTDLVVLNSGHAGEHSHADPTLGANILWGGPQGLEQSSRRTVLHEHFLGTSSTADLNRDGYLDLVLEPFAPEEGSPSEQLFLYYGSAEGFSVKQRVALAVEGYAQEHMLADFNRDHWLDIAVTTRKHDCIRIFWGSPQGFDVAREQRLFVAGPVGVDAADMNGDGWLDVLAGSYNDPVSGHRDMGSVLFWGSPAGFQHARAQWLPGFSPLGRTIADLDSDGHLDLVSPQHSGELTREDLACHIYWGSPTGLATRRRTTFFADSVNDSMVADFNSDGLLDLVVNCHTRHGDHRTQSRVLFNDGHRFTEPKIQRLPTNGPHLLWAQDVGNVYDRRYRESFTSRVVPWDGTGGRFTVRGRGQVGSGTRLSFAVRSAENREALQQAPWQPVEQEAFTLESGQRLFQYRAILQSDNGDRYPVVDRVEVRCLESP